MIFAKYEEKLCSYTLTFLVPPNTQALQEIVLDFQLTVSIVMDDGKSELKSKPAMKTSHELNINTCTYVTVS